MIVGIFGGLGYIGSRLVTKLEQNHTVLIVDKMMYNVDKKFLEGKTLYKFDIGEQKKVESFIDRCDKIVNLSAYVGENICQKYPLEAAETNQFNAIKISDYCNSKSKQMIFLSTCSNYGSSSKVCHEDVDLNPLTLYSKTKVVTETHILKTNPFGTVLRMSTIFGVSDSRTRFDIIPNQFIKEAITTKKISVHNPESIRPIIHVDDAVQIIIKFLEYDTNYSVYNVGFDSMNLTKKDMIHELSKHMKFEEEQIQSTDNRSYNVDFSRLHSEFDIKQIYTLKRGISQVLSAITLKQVDLNCSNC